MDKSIDDKLLDLLKYATIGSKLRTSLNIKLADYASQLLGYRSSRHIRGDDRDNVEEKFNELMDTLWYIINECICKLKANHTYKESIYDLDDLSLELKLEDTLYDCVVWNDIAIFVEQFFE